MDDKQWIQHLKGRMTSAGWTLVGPDPSGEGWIAAAVRFEAGSTAASGPTGFGETAIRAVEDTYRQVVGDLPQRLDDPPEGEMLENEFGGIPEGDLHEFRTIRDDFHRHGYDFRWFHPATDVWIIQWTPHGGDVTPAYGAVQDVGEYRGHDMTALEAARHAWAKFQGARGGG
jgi:hypothetical protein